MSSSPGEKGLLPAVWRVVVCGNFIFEYLRKRHHLTFAHDPEIERQLHEEDDIWLGEKKEIVFKVAREIAGYFKRRKLIANQVIEKDLEDGGLIISARVVHANEVLPIVRYLIPHIRIIRPEGLQEELERELRGYVERSG